MVVFTCNHCGSSLKKNQVDKHRFQCPNCVAVSCMDCGKDFWGEEYSQHTKCITEEEKYEGNDFQPKPSQNKGEKKQEAWIEHINNVIMTQKKMEPKLRSLLTRLTQYSNIPRKRKKFENFIRNSVKAPNDVIAKAWDVFESSLRAQKNNDISNGNEEKQSKELLNGSSEQGKGALKRKQQPCEHDDESSPQEKISKQDDADEIPSQEEVPKFKWKSVIKQALREADGQELPVKKLRKKVLSEYHARGGDGKGNRTYEELLVKFDKMIHSSPKLKVSKERVKLMN
ncbi:unnamed protein product [Darwinula stevensoni]|uniref:Cell growth-regulating nucleolar protein n=1 Tax=Darwinula stevensoni TaxID=69355 RepID=A0A7R9FR92_9CRUS|nr:unnamed protein product [Darwinula stevensoni]CAG0900979.1 unnamed protein product [Darwinula stevensoni]